MMLSVRRNTLEIRIWRIEMHKGVRRESIPFKLKFWNSEHKILGLKILSILLYFSI